VRALRERRSPCFRLPGRSVLVLLLLGEEGVMAWCGFVKRGVAPLLLNSC
jgi:hypothetical protein